MEWYLYFNYLCNFVIGFVNKNKNWWEISPIRHKKGCMRFSTYISKDRELLQYKNTQFHIICISTVDYQIRSIHLQNCSEILTIYFYYCSIKWMVWMGIGPHPVNDSQERIQSHKARCSILLSQSPVFLIYSKPFFYLSLHILNFHIY
jgi:hypothetical protein